MRLANDMLRLLLLFGLLFCIHPVNTVSAAAHEFLYSAPVIIGDNSNVQVKQNVASSVTVVRSFNSNKTKMTVKFIQSYGTKNAKTLHTETVDVVGKIFDSFQAVHNTESGLDFILWNSTTSNKCFITGYDKTYGMPNFGENDSRQYKVYFNSDAFRQQTGEQGRLVLMGKLGRVFLLSYNGRICDHGYTLFYDSQQNGLGYQNCTIDND